MRLLQLLAKIYFHKIEVKGHFPNQAMFYVSNHRNGAVDGFVIYSVFKHKLLTVLGKNLTKNPFMRLFFGGQIEIYRYPEKMAEKRHNRKELSRIPFEIEKGISVLMFPEGTSHLNKGLLPIRDGAAHMISSLKDQKFVPIGLHYEKGWSFRSNVFIHIGEPIELLGKTKEEKREELKTQLEHVYDDDYQFKKAKKNRFLSICLLPMIALFFLMNLLVMVIPFLVAKKLADDKNVIALWRILSGVPTFILQGLIYLCLGLIHPLIPIGYVVVTVVGLVLYRSWKDAWGIS